MSTSGTVGSTVISTAKLIEHALRRCGKKASDQTPEIVDIARSCLYLLLTNYANTPLNLWCVSQALIALQAGKKEYVLPVGSTSLLNVNFASPSLAQGVLVGNLFTLTSEDYVCRVGLKFSALPTADFDILHRDSLHPASILRTVSLVNDEVDSVSKVYWFDLDPRALCIELSVTAGTLEFVYAATKVYETVLEPYNRDSYAALPDKNSQSDVVTGYLFNKQINPTVIVWPVPTSDLAHLAIWVHKQVEDVGLLTQTLAIPQRWFEPTIVQLAFRLALELPDITPERVALLTNLADKFILDVRGEESDSAPINLAPNISVYSK